MRRDEFFTDRKYVSIKSLKTNYFNLDSGSGSERNNERENIVQTKCNISGGANHSTEKCFKGIRKDEGKSCADGDLDRQQTEYTPCKCFRCGSVDHLIAKCPKPSKDKGKQRKRVRFNERGNHVLQKEFENSDNYYDQKIYASIA